MPSRFPPAVPLALMLLTGCATAPPVDTSPAGLVKRDFYAVAHRTNSAKAVEQALDNGVNAMELDIRVHKGQFCANHDAVNPIIPCEPLDALLDFIKAKVEANKQDNTQKLGLIFFDFKNDDDIKNAGDKLLKLIRERLSDATGVKVLISVANLKDQGYLDGAYDNLRSGEALAVDYEDDPVAVSEFFIEKGVRNFAYGDGCCLVCSCPGAKTAIENAVSLREKRREIKLVYIWTLGKASSMQEFVDIGVDGIFVNGGWVLGTENDIPTLLRIVEGSPEIELASPDYNPFP